MTIAAVLAEGKPNSLGRTGEVVTLILNKPGNLPELFECLFHDDEYVRMRAGDTLEKVCRERPDLLKPFITRLLDEVAAVEQPSVQWHVAQILPQVSLSDQQTTKAVAVLKRFLTDANDWIVLIYSMESLAGFARQDTELVPWLRRRLGKLREDPRKSVAKRAEKLLKTL